MSVCYLLFLASLIIVARSAEEITGWIYVDNWFELYFNGEKVAEDPIIFRPHNAVKISFTAPETGLRSFAIWAQDFADDITGLEDRNGGWCLGDGGVRIVLSDGTVSSSDWKCFVTMEGPSNDECAIGGECTNTPDLCTVTYNSYPSCWNETVCSEADSWSAATEWSDDVVGWGSPTSDSDCCGLDYSGSDCNTVYYPDGCKPGDVDWGDSVFMWASDLNVHNRIICRYEYCVDGSTDCTAESLPTSSPTPQPSRSPLADAQTFGPTTDPTAAPVADDEESSASSSHYEFIIALSFAVFLASKY